MFPVFVCSSPRSTSSLLTSITSNQTFHHHHCCTSLLSAPTACYRGPSRECSCSLDSALWVNRPGTSKLTSNRMACSGAELLAVTCLMCYEVALNNMSLSQWLWSTFSVQLYLSSALEQCVTGLLCPKNMSSVLLFLHVFWRVTNSEHLSDNNVQYLHLYYI